MTDVTPARRAEKPAQTRDHQTGSIEEEATALRSGVIGAAAPFGNSAFPLPLGKIHYEHPEIVGERILEDERH